MNNKFKSFLYLAFLSITLSACVGPPKDDKCIPSDGQTNTGTGSTPTNSPGSGNSVAQTIDSAIKNGQIISTVVCKIKNQLVGSGGLTCDSNGGADSFSYAADQKIFEAFATSPEFQEGLGGAFALYIIIYGLSVAVGMVQVTLGDAVLRVAKVSGIALFALNWERFFNSAGSFFIKGTDDLISFFITTFSGWYNPGGTNSGASIVITSADNIFAGYDDLISRVFSFQTFAFISALFHAGPYAPVYAIFCIMALWWILQSIMKVVQVYIFSLFAKALLFAIAPIFIAFLLFEKTKPMFDAWVNQLVSFSLQPILITAYIGLFHQLINPFFDEFNQYKECWNRLDNTTNHWGWTFVNANSTSDDPIDFGPTSAPPISLQAMLLFMFFAWLFKSAMNMTDAIVISIANSAVGNLSNISGLETIRQGMQGAGQNSFVNRTARQFTPNVNGGG